jgi:hypothetical protein
MDNFQQIDNYSAEELQAALNRKKLSEIIEFKNDLLKKYRYLGPIVNDSMVNLIVGHVQSGKTKAIMICIIILIAIGKKPIIVVRNCIADYQQFLGRFIKSFLKELNFQKDKPNLYYISETKAAQISKNFNNIFDVPILLANAPQTGKFLYEFQKLDNDKKSKFVLLCDEADATIYNVPDAEDNIKQVQENLEQIRNHCKFVSITATPWCSIFAELRLKVADTIIIPVQSEYKSIKSLKWKIHNIVDTKRDRNVFDNIKISEIIAGLKIQGPVVDNEGNFVCTRVTLIGCYHKKMLHNSLVTTPATEREVAYLSYNGNGFLLKLSKCKIIKIYEINELKYKKERSVKRDPTTKIFKFDKSWTIPEIFQIVEYKKIHNLFITSKNLAGRGISFTSITRKTHITDQIIADNDTDCTTRRQSLRILGNFEDNHDLTVHTSLRIKNDITAEFNMFLGFKREIKSIEDGEILVPSMMNKVWDIKACKPNLVSNIKGNMRLDSAPGYVREGISGVNTYQTDTNKAIEMAKNTHDKNIECVLLTDYYNPVDLGIEIPNLHRWNDLEKQEQKDVRDLIKNTIKNHKFNTVNNKSFSAYSKTQVKTYYNNPHNLQTIDHYSGITYGNGDNYQTNETFGIIVRTVNHEDLDPDCVIMWHGADGSIRYDLNSLPTYTTKQVGKKSMFNVKNVRAYPLESPEEII